ncbi:MAG: LysR family transcriptional regulator [Mixta calida]|uniref:LysR family transcriptional regulator n=1 Tax=Mixta calida TaxID=665913 RepID=A0ABM6S242_9GAMM|nr:MULTISPECIES: LysR family transcriptional regulator [Mixta]MBS6057245.1 LysR family transcriptional regulator [Pantoea sp.]POU43708.1 LysR family transcriptional regulator [Pantoea sp. PSNIH5]POU62616.1 LysR family transcriptional regulator [Pantoea sp. PSNIH4]POY66562.1 LysR family transcriptional regulator [Pantoea sp. PSNIH3]HCW45977.1 LysR family transcriptional regulator [Erwiniaceae bacterium]
MVGNDLLKGIMPFVATVEAGSFSAAAGRLNLTSSAVSKSIARLEERLGSQLFERTTRSLKLTDAGEAYYQTCQRVVNELSEAESVLAAQRTHTVGRLRVAVPMTFGRTHVMPVINAFCREHPDLHINMTFADRFVDLFDEGVDVAVRIGGPADYPASLGVRHLGNERLVFCASPDYLRRHGTPQHLDALQQHRAVAYERVDGSTTPWRFIAADGRIASRTVNHALAFGDSEAQLSAVCAGLGIAQMATWLLQEAEQAGRVKIILPQLALDGLPLYLVWPRKKQLLPKVDALLQAFRQLTIR